MTLYAQKNLAYVFVFRIVVTVVGVLRFGLLVFPQSARSSGTLLKNAGVSNGTDKLSVLTNVLVVGNQIIKISPDAVGAPDGTTVATIDGGGRTLMPGLVDAHVHMMFNSMPQLAVMTSEIGFANLAAGEAATDMLLSGYTMCAIWGVRCSA
jgi:imidazolonepropionase-like amidohydrolase